MATTLRPIRPEDRLSLVEHLDELRKRLIICVVVFLTAFGVCLWQGDVVLDIINRPLEKTAFKNDGKSTKDPFERTAAFQAQLRRSAIASAAAFESLAAATEDPATRQAYEDLAAQNRVARALRPAARGAQAGHPRRRRAVHRHGAGRRLRGDPARAAAAALPGLRVRPYRRSRARSAGSRCR